MVCISSCTEVLLYSLLERELIKYSSDVIFDELLDYLKMYILKKHLLLISVCEK